MSWTKPQLLPVLPLTRKIIGSAQESVKNQSIERAVIEEKTLSVVGTKLSIQKDIIPLTLSYDKNTEK